MDTEITITEAPALLVWILDLLPIVFFALSVAVVIYVTRLLIRNKRENQRLRLEVGKLADELGKVAEEVHLMCEELKTASLPAKT